LIWNNCPKHIFRFVLFFVLAWSTVAVAENVPDVAESGSEAWLVTFGPGEIYWERFGHNAIWLREPASGIDHTFNFGFFDFDQENFFLNFLRGRMTYFSVAQPAQREFEFYRQQNRSIRLQKLDLDPSQYNRLRDYLLQEIKPENRNYAYDYYSNNCSTRIRDAIDLAINGVLLSHTENVTANLNFREQTRRLTEMQYWYYLGLEIALGEPVDRSVSRWDEMFIPMVLANEVAQLPGRQGIAGQSLVLQDIKLYSSSQPAPATTLSSTWYRYLLLGLLVTGIAWLSGKFIPAAWLAGLCNAWLLIIATNGLVLAFLWWFTDHSVASNNANLLLFNPFVLLGLIPVLRTMGAVLLAAGVLICLVLQLLPGHQYNLDVIALLAPVNLAVAAWLMTKRANNSGKQSVLL
jgi:hypothetical protein